MGVARGVEPQGLATPLSIDQDYQGDWPIYQLLSWVHEYVDLPKNPSYVYEHTTLQHYGVLYMF